jgi:hypothetical protein
MRQHSLIPFKPGLVAVLCFGAAMCGPAQTLVNRYSFNDTAGSTTFTDLVSAANGTLDNTLASNPNSASLDGAQLVLDGTGGFARLPSGLIHSKTQVTIEFWGSFSNSNPFWTRTFAFGDQNGTGGENTGLDYCHYAGFNYQNLNCQTPSSGVFANNPSGLNGQTNVHVTCVIDPVGNKMYYYNGSRVNSDPVLNNGAGGTVPALSGINDVNGLLGKSLFDVDATLAGTLNEFRIYSGILPSSTVALNDATGPNNIITNPGAIQALHFSAPVNPLLVNQSSQQNLRGDFANVTNLDLIAYGGVTYSSANTNVVTINSNGVARGVAVGTANVVATYGALSATNSLTVVSLPAVLTHRYSFNGSDASDSVGGANGTLMGNASVTGGQLMLDGSFGTYVDLPGSKINLPTNTSVTFEAWVTLGDVPTWAYLFGFGNTNNGAGLNQIASVPCADSGFHHWGITENFSGNRTTSWAHGWRNLTMHLTCVVDPPNSTYSIYRDGVLELGQYNASAPLSNVPTNYAFIGRSFYDVDPYMPAAIDEFRIYSGVLTPQQVALTQKNGPNATNLDVGALSSIVLVPTNYAAYASLVAPVVLANYVNVSNVNLLPTVSAGANVALSGLVVTSSDTNIVSVNAQNMLTTGRPGTVTLTAIWGGKTNSATVQINNKAALTHRYSFATDGDTSDSVGGANGTLVGVATITGGQLQLTGGNGDYLDLPPGMLTNYNAVTVDTWVTFGAAQHWARLWEFVDVGPGTQNEFYFAPGWNATPNANFYSTSFPFGGSATGPVQLENATFHITCTYGDGTMQVYTNGVLETGASNLVAPASSAGTVSTTIGHSPFNDPGINGSVDEFRIYSGRLAPDEIQASDVLGPSVLLTNRASMKALRSGTNVVLSWPIAAAGFSVQAKSNIVGGTWVTLTNAPALVGTNNWQVTIPASGSPRFLRLWR